MLLAFKMPIVATKLVEQDMTWDLLENQMRLEGATAVREVLTQIGLSVGTSLRLVCNHDSESAFRDCSTMRSQSTYWSPLLKRRLRA